jgi:hypothetical protein
MGFKPPPPAAQSGSADLVTVEPAVGGDTDVQAVLETHESRIDGLAGGGSGVTIDTHATVYVAVDGDDANDGLTWGTAKATIAAAKATLPLGDDATTPIGVIELGAGQFDVASSMRVDTVGVTNGDATITDASITSDDVGAFVINPSWFAAGAYIVSVIPGVSFELSQAPSNTGASVSAEIHRPGFVLPANVTLRGQGASGIKDSEIDWSNVQPVTKISDSGSGIAVAIEPGTANDPTAVRSTIEKLAIWGDPVTPSNIAGLWSANVFQTRVQEVDIAYHGVAGIAVSGNWEGGVFEDLLLLYNGTTGATRITGGFVNWGNSPTAMAFRNIFFLHNRGFGAFVGHNGAAFYDCTFGNIETTAYAGEDTGVHVSAQGGDLGCVAFDNCEFDITAGPQHVTLQGPALFKSCLFQGGTTADYAIVLADAGAAPLVLLGCVFYGHAVASVFCDTGVYPTWLGCTSTDPLFITSDPSVAASAANGLGTPSTTGATGASPPFAISDTTGLQTALDSKPTAALDTDTSLTANSDAKVASQKAVKAYVLANAGGGGGGSGVDRSAVAGLKAWTWDPALNNNAVAGSGGVLLTATIVVPENLTVSKLHAIIAVGGDTLTVAYGALWSADGTTRIAKTASQTAAWTTPGAVEPTLVAEAGQSLDLAAGVYIVSVIGTGTSSPQFASWNTGDIGYTNVGSADPAFRMAYLFPADNSTSVLTGLTAQLKAPWMGLS